MMLGTPITAADHARVACAALTDAQRIALAIGMVRDIDTPENTFHLMRLGNFAIARSNELTRVRFEKECG
jgi:polynucleotide 5'-kinase involved in rRNA processing